MCILCTIIPHKGNTLLFLSQNIIAIFSRFLFYVSKQPINRAYNRNRLTATNISKFTKHRQIHELGYFYRGPGPNPRRAGRWLFFFVCDVGRKFSPLYDLLKVLVETSNIGLTARPSSVRL